MIEVETSEFEAPVDLRLATNGDVPAIARLFVEAFPAHPAASFSTALRHKFIAAHAPECFTMVATDRESKHVLGFAIGGQTEQLDRARQGFIQGNVVPLTIQALLRRETYRRGSFVRLPSPASRRRRASPGAACELRYVAVAAAERGSGIGSALLRAVENDVLLGQPYFVWVLADHVDAMRFYLRHGFREEHRIDGHARLIKTGSFP